MEQTQKHATQHPQDFQSSEDDKPKKLNQIYVLENINLPELKEHPGDIARKYDYLRHYATSG